MLVGGVNIVFCAYPSPESELIKTIAVSAAAAASAAAVVLSVVLDTTFVPI